MRPVINATGVVVHTNLGRSPWAEEAIASANAVSRGYCNLELELETGRRGGRMAGVSAQLGALVGAEAALVVNNNAAAVLLMLTALAAGREVVCSRGELVEIGGAFRVPDVIASGGARLREVGTTNRTRLADYQRATGPETAAWLRVHPSNFRVIGFTEAVPRAAFAAGAAAAGALSLEDLGSGAPDELRAALADGVDLVSCSGDKLLGGPQSGILVGRAALIAQLRAHPLYRALRLDKTLLAALERTLGLHLAGAATPTGRMLALPLEVLRTRAEALSAEIPGSRVELDVGYAGGGAMPEEALPSVVVAVPGGDALAARLRTGSPAVLARLGRGAVLLDPRAVREDELPALAAAVRAALADGR